MNVKEIFEPLYTCQPFLRQMMKTVAGIKAYKDLIQEAEEKVSHRIGELEECLADTDKAIADLVDAVKAKDALLVCYRVGRQPSKKLFVQLDKAKAAIAKYGGAA